MGCMNNSYIIFGGSGFLGRQLTKDILSSYDPSSITIYSRNEAKQAEMKKLFYNPIIKYVIGDIKDKDNVYKHTRGKDIAINCAAMKRIDTCEENPAEAVHTNIYGHLNVCEAALEHNIKCLCYVSTDKAKNPQTMYGATKYVAEQITRNSYHEKGFRRTRFVTVRYGNVKRSTGSVLNIWEEQFMKTGTIDVRDSKMTRFFMGVDEASKLVLSTIENGEENTEHSLPMKSGNILELARYLYPTAKINITGMLHSEKLHEDLYDGYSSKDHIVRPEELAPWYM
jgi:UDP-N-acetylglucosamine 4,6-dehydratase/5-epimerase